MTLTTTTWRWSRACQNSASLFGQCRPSGSAEESSGRTVIL